MSEGDRRLVMTLYRYNRALCVLLLIPMAVYETAVDPSGRHVVMFAITGAQTVWASVMYRVAVKRWAEADDA